MPSVPGCSVVIRPMAHFVHGRFFSFISTTASNLSCGPSLIHLFRLWSSFKYSRYHRAQKSWRIFEMCCHVDKRFTGTEVRSPSGRAVMGLPIKKCAGDSTNASFGSEDIVEIGLEFKIPSTSVVNVLSSSNVNSESPITRLRWCLKIFTVASHSPPKCGAIGGIKCHVILCELANLFTRSLCSSELNNAYTSFNWLFAPTKLVPLSEYILSGKPRLAMNRHNAARNPSDDRSLTTSRCTALIVKHTNTHT